MKKLVILFALVFLLCALLPSCAKTPEATGTLRIITNAGFEDDQFGGEDDLRHVIEYYGGLPSGIDIELEVLSLDGNDLHSRLTHLRTEILAGGGPDVFLMVAPVLPDRELLFPIPKKAMENKVFLPLDELRDSAQHMEWDAINPVILAAGCNDEGQMLLPMYYGYDLAETQKNPSAVPKSWDEAVNSQDDVIRNGFGSAIHRGAFRDLAFTEIADYHSETLLITEEELKRRVKEACAFSYKEESTQAEWADSLVIIDGIGNPDSLMFPLYNVDGGITAKINSYIAVNRNTTHKEDALALVDMMMGREFLSFEAFWSEERPKMHSEMFLFPYLRAWNGGNPVYDDYFTDGQRIAYESYLPEGRVELYNELIEEISYVYIPSGIDQELKKLITDCQAAGSEDEMDNLISKCYTTMKMMLAES